MPLSATMATDLKAKLIQGLQARNQDNFGEARATFDAILLEAQELGDRRSQVMALLELIRTAEMRGLSSAVRTLSAQCLPLTQELHLENERACCLVSLGNMALQERELEEATRYFTEALGLAEQTGDPELQSMALHQLGRTCEAAGAIVEAMEYWTRSLAKAEATDNFQIIINALLNLGFAHSEYLLKPLEGKALFERAVELASQTGRPSLLTRARRGLALADRRAAIIGRPEESLRFTTSGLSIKSDGVVVLEAFDLTGQTVPATLMVNLPTTEGLPTIDVRGPTRLSLRLRPASEADAQRAINAHIEYFNANPVSPASEARATP